MQENQSYRFLKKERLKNKKQISQIFTEGISIKKYPFQLLYLPKKNSLSTSQIAFVIAKRNIKLAVKRNRIKRLMRESYRLQKHLFSEELSVSYYIVLSYLAKEELPYKIIFHKIGVLLEVLARRRNKEEA